MYMYTQEWYGNGRRDQVTVCLYGKGSLVIINAHTLQILHAHTNTNTNVYTHVQYMYL